MFKLFIHRLYVFAKGHHHSFDRELDLLSGLTWPYKQPHIKICSCGKTKIVERVA